MEKDPVMSFITKLINLFFMISCFVLVPFDSESENINPNNSFIKDLNAESLTAKLNDLLPGLMDENKIPGVSIAVLKNSNVILTKSYGMQSTKTKIAATNGTIYEFGSLSKPVFALAVLQLANKGKIDLDKPLYKYWVLKNAAPEARYKQITARMVLSHTAGFLNWSYNRNHIAVAFPPGKQFSYSGEGYYYLQKVVEEITGKHLQQIVDEQVFTPLQMNRSSFIWKTSLQAAMAHGHSNSGEFEREISDWKAVWEGVSASSLLTDITDYSKFVSYILKEYKMGNPLIKSMVKPIVEVKDDGNWGRILWSLGWGIEETKQGYNIWHWGNTVEFRSLVVVNLKNGNGLVYVANSSSGLVPVKSIIQSTIGGVHPLTRYSMVN